MSLGKRLINTGGVAACRTDSVQAFGADNAFSSNVALYQLDGNANDTTTNYNGAPTDITYGTGYIDQAAVFNGNSSEIDLPVGLGASGDRARSLWINVSAFPASGGDTIYYIGQQGANDDYEYVSVRSDGTIRYQERHDSGGAGDLAIDSQTTISLNQWYNIIIVFDGLNRLMYINSSTALGNTGTKSTQTVDNSAYAGNLGSFRGLAGTLTYDGSIDQVRIFDKALNAENVATLYAETAATASNTNPLGQGSGVALYTLDYDGLEASGLYDGTPDSAVQFGVAGVTNYAARFSSNTTGIVNTSLQLNSTAHSISLWVKPAEVVSGRWNTIFMSNFLGYPSGFLGKRLDQSTSFHYRTESGNELYFTLASADTWYHIVITRDSGGVDIYVDGSFVTSNSDSMGTYSNSSYEKTAIGSNSLYPAEYFKGDIDQVRIFNKVLSTDEIATLYNSGAGETACVYTCTTDTVDYPTTNVAYYKLDNSAEDETTNANDGTWSGTEEYAFGRYGQAALFNGSNSRIDLPNVLSGFTDTYSFSIWVKIDNVNNFPFFGTDPTSTAATNIIRFALHQNGNYYFDFGNNSSARMTGTTPSEWRNNNWHHFVFVSSSTQKLVYVDGNPYNSISSSAAVSGKSTLTVGTYLTNYGGGLYDQIRIFSSALTSDQVTELYEEKQCFDTVTAPTGNLRFDEFWAGYDDGQSNRAEFKSSGQIVDFNTYSEGHAVLNQNAQTSGKYYLEIQLISSSGHEGFGVFNRSTNTDYDVSPYVSKNPIDANYGATLYSQGSIVYVGNVSQSGFTNLSLGSGDIVCMAVDVDEKRIWWGRRDGLSDSTITWNNGNPNGGYGGLEVSFVPSDVIVAHASESSSRYAEFKVLNHADMLEAPFNFSYLDGAFTASLTENEANF